MASTNPKPDDSIVTSLGKVIQDKRRRLRLSQDELAEKAGLHRTYISEIERRSRNVSVKILAQIAQALGVLPSELMEEAERLNDQQQADEG